MSLLSLGKPWAVDNISLCAEVGIGNFSAFVTEWREKNREWSKLISEHYMKHWDKTDFASLTLPLATETWNNLTF